MSWVVLVTMIVVLGLALGFFIARRRELEALRRTMDERDRAKRLGRDRAQLQHPVVDLTRCLGLRHLHRRLSGGWRFGTGARPSHGCQWCPLRGSLRLRKGVPSEG
jgi:hypothetical protein